MSRIPRELTPRTTLESLRRQAKRWLKELEAGDADAAARFRSVFPGNAPPKLREVQQAVAREFGLASWAALKQAIEDGARSHADRVRLFLEKSAIRYNTAPGTTQWNTYEPDRPARGAYAARLLARHPEIAHDSIHTAVASGDVDAVRRFVARDASLAEARGGPDGWTPLLRLAYTRLPVEAASTNAVEIARVLLEHGASPHATWSDGENAFTVLTGAIGGGEGRQPAHPRAEPLAKLLMERGADPLDGQALYNTSIGDDDTFWLELLWAESERRGETARWSQKVKELGKPPLEYLLGNAVPGQPRRAAWLLAHGAPGDGRNAYSREPVVKHALLAGQQELVDLLVRHGAVVPALTPLETFCAAVMQGDVDAARRLAGEHPAMTTNAHPMMLAVGRNDVAVVRLLLDLGVSPEVSSGDNLRPLHTAADSNAMAAARLLIERGAEIDPVETRYNSTPLGHASFHQHAGMVSLLAPLSRDVRGLCFSAQLARLRELLSADRSLAIASSRGEAPLFALPDDEESAVDVAELLLSFGADATVRNAKGSTPAEAARERGLLDAADLLDG
jgi:ankyrin repeat protein